jgi:hypothetical protein
VRRRAGPSRSTERYRLRVSRGTEWPGIGGAHCNRDEHEEDTSFSKRTAPLCSAIVLHAIFEESSTHSAYAGSLRRPQQHSVRQRPRRRLTQIGSRFQWRSAACPRRQDATAPSTAHARNSNAQCRRNKYHTEFNRAACPGWLHIRGSHRQGTNRFELVLPPAHRARAASYAVHLDGHSRVYSPKYLSAIWMPSSYIF